jgi:tetratricopeptide (TPR) repeat protein
LKPGACRSISFTIISPASPDAAPARARGDESAQAALVLDPNFMMAHYRLGESLLQLGKVGAALDAFVKARTLSNNSPDLMALAAYANARAGRRREALDTLRTLTAQRTSGTRYVSAYALALVAAGLDDRDLAFTWLDRALEERAWGVAFLGVEPDWDPLRKDPRFAALTRRAGVVSGR